MGYLLLLLYLFFLLMSHFVPSLLQAAMITGCLIAGTIAYVSCSIVFDRVSSGTGSVREKTSAIHRSRKVLVLYSIIALFAICTTLLALIESMV